MYRPPEAIITFPDEKSAWQGLAIADKLLPMAEREELNSPTIRLNPEPPPLKPLTQPGPPEIQFEGVGQTYLWQVVQSLNDCLIPHQLKTWKY